MNKTFVDQEKLSFSVVDLFMDDKIQYNGLSSIEVDSNRKKYGSNKLILKEKSILFSSLQNTVTEPMFILLLITAAIYFYANAYQEGILMVVSISLVTSISLFQEFRSRSSIQALKKISATKSLVIRNSNPIKIEADEIVVNDILLLEEGELVPADGTILISNDLMVNESILTGESLPVIKSPNENNIIYRGTLINAGSATIRITAVGNNTAFGKIGISLKNINIEKTPLQIQIKHFVKYMVSFGIVAFLLIVLFNYLTTFNLLASLMKGLTLAMSILPEEIPVAFTTFQALGAFRLLKKNSIIVKQPQYVETLGTATVICADKTGTITENRMSIVGIFDYKLNRNVLPSSTTEKSTLEIIEWAMWSSETNPFDPMEKAIHNLYSTTHSIDKRNTFQQVHEYPLSGHPPMMTHIFKHHQEIIVATKGAPESILKQSSLSAKEKDDINIQINKYAIAGYRVLGIGKAIGEENNWPVSQDEFKLEFLGLIAFQDPPKPNMIDTIEIFRKAGIKFKMITGDFPETAVAIAKQIKIDNPENVITGDQIIKFNTEELALKIKNTNVFARMFPEAKLKIIEALKLNGEITAMTGDGVNDAPALKAAHIGISMGNNGSEVAKSAASLIITDDNLAHMTDAIELGRRIYDNLAKAVLYIVSIHIPIILIVLIPTFLNPSFNTIFSPVHVIFLELIMGPTCSIIYENEPVETGSMLKPPRKKTMTFLSSQQLSISIIQGIVITAGCFLAGYFFYRRGGDQTTIRSVVFITLLFSNIFLTLFNRSYYYSVFLTIKYKNYLLPIMILATLSFIFIIQFFPLTRSLFDLKILSSTAISICLIFAFMATYWFEVFKWFKRKRKPVLLS